MIGIGLQKAACAVVLLVAALAPGRAAAQVGIGNCGAQKAALDAQGGISDEGLAQLGDLTHGVINELDDADMLRELLKLQIADTWQYEIQTEWNDAHRALLTCLFETRIAQIEARGPAMVEEAQDEAPDVAAAEEDAAACGTAAANSVNGDLQDIDARVARFLETPLGKQQGSASPMLQVVMWATREQSRAIKAQCADDPAYAQRLRELDASYEGAMNACRQLRRDPDSCGPVSPEDTLVQFPFTQADQQRMDADEQARRDIDWSKLAPEKD